MSEDKEEGIEADIDDNNDDFGMIEPITSSEEVKESSTEPVEIFKEEVVTVVENPNVEENEEEEIRIDNSIGEDVKALTVQLRKITDVVESLQSQVKQLQETIKLGSRTTTTPARRRARTTTTPARRRARTTTTPARRRARTNTKTRKKTITGGSRRTRGSKKK